MNRVPVPILHRSLAASGFGMARLLQWAMAAVVVGSTLMAGWRWHDGRALSEEATRLAASAARIQEANRRFTAESLREGFDVSGARAKTLANEIAFSKQVTEHRAFSWTRFLSDLEEAVPPRVSVNSVTLAPKTAVISLSGSALALVDITAFVNALDVHRAFQNVVLSNYRVKEPKKDPKSIWRSRSTVEFMLSVTYRPPE